MLKVVRERAGGSEGENGEDRYEDIEGERREERDREWTYSGGGERARQRGAANHMPVLYRMIKHVH